MSMSFTEDERVETKRSMYLVVFEIIDLYGRDKVPAAIRAFMSKADAAFRKSGTMSDRDRELAVIGLGDMLTEAAKEILAQPQHLH